MANVFENFRKICLEIYKLDPGKYISAPGLAWPGILKKAADKSELLTGIDMLLMVEKGIKGRICNAYR